jgi:DNA modification methylase
MYTLHNADCLVALKRVPAGSIDSVVTDPPAGISFMGTEWDDDKGGRKKWVEWMTQVMQECLRVLKPGGYALVWALPRTSHWTATAIEDAGFEIRDIITHHFGSGFPKSLDVSKAIDKEAGAKRKIIGERPDAAKLNKTPRIEPGGWETGSRDPFITAPATQDAAKWAGWGTAIKPATEHWILCRKPIAEKTVAQNVVRHGTGALNINASRIPLAEGEENPSINRYANGKPQVGNNGWEHKNRGGNFDEATEASMRLGRWPANLIMTHSDGCEDGECQDDCPVRQLNEQSGVTKSCRSKQVHEGYESEGAATFIEGVSHPDNQYDDSGGASRFFYCIKPTRAEKEEGLDSFEVKHVTCRPNSDDPTIRHKSTSIKEKLHGRIGKNPHPTVKAVKLMEYLIRMITPTGGTVLDPFMGSGSTGVAAVTLGFKFVGVEMDADFFKIADARIAARQSRIAGAIDFS